MANGLTGAIGQPAVGSLEGLVVSIAAVASNCICSRIAAVDYIRRRTRSGMVGAYAVYVILAITKEGDSVAEIDVERTRMPGV